MLELGLAFLAGVLTILAPCVLPMLPILLANSIGDKARHRPLFIASGFVVTFSALGMLFGVLAHQAGAAPDVVRRAGILLLAVSGLLRIWPQLWERLVVASRSIFAADAGSRPVKERDLGGFVLGMTLGIVWTPCAGPVLASIFALVASAQDLHVAAVLLTAYAAGAGIPMLLIGYGGRFATARVRFLTRHSRRMQQAFGATAVATAGLMYFQYDILVFAWLSHFYPSIAQGL